MSSLQSLLQSTKTEIQTGTGTLHVPFGNEREERYNPYVGLQDSILFNSNGEYVGKPFDVNMIPGFYQGDQSQEFDPMRQVGENLLSNILSFGNNSLQEGENSNLFLLSRDDQLQTDEYPNALEFGIQRGKVNVSTTQDGTLINDIKAIAVEPIFNIRRKRTEIREGIQLFSPDPEPVANWNSQKISTEGVIVDSSLNREQTRFIPNSEVNLRIHDVSYPIDSSFVIRDVSDKSVLFYSNNIRQMIQNMDLTTTGKIESKGINRDSFEDSSLQTIGECRNGFQLDQGLLGLYSNQVPRISFNKDLSFDQYRTQPNIGDTIGSIEWKSHTVVDTSRVYVDPSLSYVTMATLKVTHQGNQSADVDFKVRTTENGDLESIWSVIGGAFTIGGDTQVIGDINISGNLNVAGQTTIIESKSLAVIDPVITVGYQDISNEVNAVVDTNERGILIEYAPTVGVLNRGFLGYSQTSDTFVAYKKATWTDPSYSKLNPSTLDQNILGDLLIGSIDASSVMVQHSMDVSKSLTVLHGLTTLAGGVTDGVSLLADGELGGLITLTVGGSSPSSNDLAFEVTNGPARIDNNLSVTGGQANMVDIYVPDPSHVHYSFPSRWRAGELTNLRGLTVGREQLSDPYSTTFARPTSFVDRVVFEDPSQLSHWVPILPNETEIIDIIIRQKSYENGSVYEVFDLSSSRISQELVDVSVNPEIMLYHGNYRFRNQTGKSVSFLIQDHHMDHISQSIVSGTQQVTSVNDFNTGLMELPESLYNVSNYPLNDTDLSPLTNYTFYENGSVFDLTVHREFGQLSLATNAGTELEIVDNSGNTSYYQQGIFLGRYNAFRFSATASGLRGVTFRTPIASTQNVLIDSSLVVTENVRFQDRLDISESLTVGADLTVSGVSRLENRTVIDNFVDISLRTVQIDGSLNLNGRMDVSGDVLFRNIVTSTSQLVSTGQTILANTDVSGQFDLVGELNITGPVTQTDGSINIFSDVFLHERLDVSGSTIFRSVLTVSNDMIVRETSTFNGEIIMNDNIQMNETLTSDGTVILNDRVYINDNIDISHATIQTTLHTVSGSITTFNGEVHLNNTLTSTAPVDLQSTLNVDGELTAYQLSVGRGGFTINGPFDISGNYTQSGPAIFSSETVMDASFVTNSRYTANGENYFTGQIYSSGGIEMTDGYAQLGTTVLHPTDASGDRHTLAVHHAQRGMLLETDSSEVPAYFIDCSMQGIGLLGSLMRGTNGFGLQITSDERKKERISNLSEERSINIISRLQPRTFHWRSENEQLRKEQQTGFIAQEFQKVVPELVNRLKDDQLCIDTQGLIPYLVSCIQKIINHLNLNE